MNKACVRWSVVALGTLLLMGGCATQRPPAADTQPGGSSVPSDPRALPPGYARSYVVFGKRYYVLKSADGFVEEGLASWYGPKFHGRKTANGETYNMHGVTAAHKSLPLGTWVRVTNLDNLKSLDVRINDRGPFVDNRVIDLSLGAAKVLDVVGPGTAPVRVETLSAAVARTAPAPSPSVITSTIDRPAVIESTPAPDAPPIPPAANPPVGPATSYDTTTRLPAPAADIDTAPAEASVTDVIGEAPFRPSGFIQIASFSEQSNAERMVTQLEQSGFENVIIQALRLDSGMTHRVRLGPLTSADQQRELLRKLTAIGLRGFRVVSN